MICNGAFNCLVLQWSTGKNRKRNACHDTGGNRTLAGTDGRGRTECLTARDPWQPEQVFGVVWSWPCAGGRGGLELCKAHFRGWWMCWLKWWAVGSFCTAGTGFWWATWAAAGVKSLSPWEGQPITTQLITICAYDMWHDKCLVCSNSHQ